FPPRTTRLTPCRWWWRCTARETRRRATCSSCGRRAPTRAASSSSRRRARPRTPEAMRGTAPNAAPAPPRGEEARREYAIRPQRIILNGFSAGGTMAYFIGLSRAERFSGLAIQSSALSAGEYVNGGPLLPAAWKVPVSHFHGDMDMNFTAASALDGINALHA